METLYLPIYLNNPSVEAVLTSTGVLSTGDIGRACSSVQCPDNGVKAGCSGCMFLDESPLFVQELTNVVNWRLAEVDFTKYTLSMDLERATEYDLSLYLMFCQAGATPQEGVTIGELEYRVLRLALEREHAAIIATD